MWWRHMKHAGAASSIALNARLRAFLRSAGSNVTRSVASALSICGSEMPMRGDPPVSKYCDSATDGSTTEPRPM
jgi:hypothetical protein